MIFSRFQYFDVAFRNGANRIRKLYELLWKIKATQSREKLGVSLANDSDSAGKFEMVTIIKLESRLNSSFVTLTISSISPTSFWASANRILTKFGASFELQEIVIGPVLHIFGREKVVRTMLLTDSSFWKLEALLNHSKNLRGKMAMCTFEMSLILRSALIFTFGEPGMKRWI